jgi:hypothetical protein
MLPITLRTDFEILMRIENGAITMKKPQDPKLKATYRAILVGEDPAYVRALSTGQVLHENPLLMVKVNSIIKMCVS